MGIVSGLRKVVVGVAATVFFLYSSLLLSSALSQEHAKQQPALQYEVAVTVKLIQVYVTDKKGTPVSDLIKEDFAVFDNRKAVTITEFEKHGLLPALSEPWKEVDEGAISQTPAPSPRDVNRKFFLFLDFAYNHQKGVVKALKAASHFLKTQLVPSDEVALLSNSLLKGVIVHEYLTTDHRKVLEAVEAMSAREVVGRASEIEERYWLEFDREAQSSRSGGSPILSSQYSPERQEAKVQTEHYILRLTALAKALRMVPGQKGIILFSTGVPTSMIYGHQAANPFDVGDSRLRPLYEGMLKEFAGSDCAFYVFDTRESARVASLFAAEDFGVGSALFKPQGVFRDSGVFRDDQTTGLDSLKRLSDRTGGKFFSNINLYEKNLHRVEEITRAYYVLGFPVSEKWDGRFHELKVELKRKDCEVRTQAGYFNPKPYSEISDLEKELQLYDLALNERSTFEAPKGFPIEALAYDAGSGPRVRIIASIPKETLKALAGKSIELIALVFDDAENLVSLQRTTSDFSLPATEDIVFTAGTTAPPGRCRCRLVIRNLETGESAVASTVINIAKQAPDKLALFSPLLVVPKPPAMQLEGHSLGKTEIFTWRDIYPYDEKQFAPLAGPVSRARGKLMAVVPYMVGGLARPQIVLTANLVNSATGQNQPPGFSPLYSVRTGSVETQILEFAIGDVPPGRYLLYFHVADAVGKSMDHRHVPLIIQP